MSTATAVGQRCPGCCRPMNPVLYTQKGSGWFGLGFGHHWLLMFLGVLGGSIAQRKTRTWLGCPLCACAPGQVEVPAPLDEVWKDYKDNRVACEVKYQGTRAADAEAPALLVQAG
jgi:hypothetical protein